MSCVCSLLTPAWVCQQCWGCRNMPLLSSQLPVRSSHIKNLLMAWKTEILAWEQGKGIQRAWKTPEEGFLAWQQGYGAADVVVGADAFLHGCLACCFRLPPHLSEPASRLSTCMPEAI